MVERIGNPDSRIKYKYLKDGDMYEKKERKITCQNDANNQIHTDMYLEALREISKLAEER